MYTTLTISSPSNHVQTLLLNRPSVLNAINTQMAEELRDFFLKFRVTKKSGIRVLILTGAGEKSFCSGADLKERKGMDDRTWFKQHKLFEDMGESIRKFELPLIGAINGVATGGGCEIAMMCDILYASQNALFSQPEVIRGIIPGLGGTQRLPRLIGMNHAKELLFTGKTISAKEAFRIGLVNKVVDSDALMNEALQLAQKIAANGPIAVRLVKKAVDQGFGLPLDKALKIEIKNYNSTVDTKDRREGINAFNEKRAPKFKNQ